MLIPAEELFRIEEGKRYGWPYCYFDGTTSRKVLNPEYGGDGSLVGMCLDRERPLTAYPTSGPAFPISCGSSASC